MMTELLLKIYNKLVKNRRYKLILNNSDLSTKANFQNSYFLQRLNISK